METYINDIQFNHFVVDSEGLRFGSARSGRRILNFLITSDGVRKQYHGRWQELESNLAGHVRERAQAAYCTAPTFRVEHFN